MTLWKTIAIKNLRRDANKERAWADRWRGVGNETFADNCDAKADECDEKADVLEGSEQ